jgi:hypothetical protein
MTFREWSARALSEQLAAAIAEELLRRAVEHRDPAFRIHQHVGDRRRLEDHLEPGLGQGALAIDALPRLLALAEQPRRISEGAVEAGDLADSGRAQHRLPAVDEGVRRSRGRRNRPHDPPADEQRTDQRGGEQHGADRGHERQRLPQSRLDPRGRHADADGPCAVLQALERGVHGEPVDRHRSGDALGRARDRAHVFVRRAVADPALGLPRAAQKDMVAIHDRCDDVVVDSSREDLSEHVRTKPRGEHVSHPSASDDRLRHRDEVPGVRRPTRRSDTAGRRASMTWMK